MSGRRLALLAVLLALAGVGSLAIAAWLLEDENGSAAPSSRPSETSDVPDRVPTLKGEDPITRETVALAHETERPVVLTVWASWCPACGRGAEALAGLAQRHKDEVDVLGLDLQDDRSDAKAFYEEFGWTFPSIADRDGLMSAQLGIGELPTTLFLDTERLVMARIDGVATRGELERALAETQRQH